MEWLLFDFVSSGGGYILGELKDFIRIGYGGMG
jgi:hypothetical protein